MAGESRDEALAKQEEEEEEEDRSVFFYMWQSMQTWKVVLTMDEYLDRTWKRSAKLP